MLCFFFQAEDGIRDLVRSRGLGDVYKRQIHASGHTGAGDGGHHITVAAARVGAGDAVLADAVLSLIHI